MGNIFGSESDDEDEGGGMGRNEKFYRGIKASSSSLLCGGHKIDRMLRWRGKHDKLEHNHEFIQWLFPTPNPSHVNSRARALTEAEAKAIRDDPELRKKVLGAYIMMLDFYGLELVNRVDGTVGRQEDCEERLDHLNRSSHNFRRITRILVSLGELGFERYQAKLVEKLLEEAVVYMTLPNTLRSAMKYWIDAIKDDQERQEMWRRYYELVTPATPTARDSDLRMTPAAPTVRGSDPESRCSPGRVDSHRDRCRVGDSAACRPNRLAHTYTGRRDGDDTSERGASGGTATERTLHEHHNYTDNVRRDGDGASEHRASANGRDTHMHHDDSEHHIEFKTLIDSRQEAFI